MLSESVLLTRLVQRLPLEDMKPEDQEIVDTVKTLYAIHNRAKDLLQWWEFLMEKWSDNEGHYFNDYIADLTEVLGYSPEPKNFDEEEDE